MWSPFKHARSLIREFNKSSEPIIANLIKDEALKECKLSERIYLNQLINFIYNNLYSHVDLYLNQIFLVMSCPMCKIISNAKLPVFILDECNFTISLEGKIGYKTSKEQMYLTNYFNLSDKESCSLMIAILSWRYHNKTRIGLEK